MSRSIVMPLLALAGIVLYGTTRAASPDLAVPPAGPPRILEIGASARPSPPPEPTGPPAPPPAPRLRSEELAEGAAAASDTARASTEARPAPDAAPGPLPDAPVP